VTTKKQRGSLGKTMRDFDRIVGGSKTKTFLGEAGVAPDRAEVRKMSKRSAKILAKVDAEGLLYLEAFVKHKSHAAAYMATHPEYTGKNSSYLGWREMQRIEKVVSKKQIKAACGLSDVAVWSAVGRGLVAKRKSRFIHSATGKIVESEEYEDNPTQIAAASLAAKLEGMVPDDKPGVGTVQVNIISYLDPATAKPWPGGGRCAPDGVLRPTVGADSYEALVARGAIRPALPAPDGSLGEPKDQP